MLDKFKHLNIKKANIPNCSMKLNYYCDKMVAQLEYTSTIKSFIYVMYCTRPDITFVIFKLARYKQAESKSLEDYIARVFGYLKRTIDLGLFYSDFPAVMKGYYD